MSLTLSSTAGSDFNDSLVTTVTFGPGMTSAAYPVPVLDDSDVESTESFAAILSTAESNVNIGAPSAIVNILDDDRKLFSQHKLCTRQNISVLDTYNF